jgi:hypothetical protein
MKIKLLAVALLTSAAVVGDAYAGSHHNGGGGNVVSGRSGGPRGGGAPSFSSAPMRSFSGNRMMYSGRRFSSVGMGGPAYGQRFVHSTSSAPVVGRQFGPGNMGVSRANQFRNSSHLAQNGNGFARNNAGLHNQRTGTGQFRNGNRLVSNWRSHVIGQHSANWHSNWDHHHDHFFNGHRWCFIGGSWFAFDLGFYPWGPWWWDYPYYGYGYYGYPYNYGYYQNGYNGGYGYGYGYTDPGTYNDQSGYNNGYNDQSGYQNGYGNQSANSTVAAAQDRLSRDGFYSGQIDGVLGPETRHAIVRFQTKHGLGISGELTHETVSALGLHGYASGY